tara:strand:- start:284 stop:424 length:141 start_codon:yes stop_codon:yes gene_type:complete
MKVRISATIGRETEKILRKLLKDKDYRNQSHVIEKAIEKLWEDEND